MAQEKLSDRSIATITSGGFVHIILPDGGSPSGFASWRIAIPDLLGIVKEKFANKSANFTEVLDADVLVTRIDFLFVTGTPVVKVGTTLGGNDVISGRTLSTIKDSTNPLSKYFKTSKTLYFTITGGTVDILLFYNKNHNT